MRTIGLIGGLSWFSTAVYYKTINQFTNERLGGAHSAKLILFSVDFEEFKTLQEANQWKEIGHMLSVSALRLEKAGADCLILCSNTPHLVADRIQEKLNIPLIHIAEETAKEIVSQKITKVGLLGTKFTMEHTFFKEHLSKYDLEVMIPDDSDRDFIHMSIFSELTKGIFNDETKKQYLKILEKLKNNGVQGVIFGCTEISLLIKPADCNVAVFDTTLIHSKSAVDFALSPISDLH
jgi:aspartate racemase